MRNHRPYHGPKKLILAFDIGTTCSSASYCILEPHQVPEVLPVARFPAQGEARADTKVPSLLYYDKTGTVKATGAEVLDQGVTRTAQIKGWTKAEWWKIHLRPTHPVTPADDLPPLPPGKSAIDVLTDFIKYLFDCCKSYIQGRHSGLTWSSLEHSIEYILTYPGGWDEQHVYCRALERTGLVPSTSQGPSRVHMLTEGEAALRSCLSSFFRGEMDDSIGPQGIVVIDAGGGLISLSVFSVTIASNRISCKEIAQAETRSQGSIFVTMRAKAVIKRKLEGWARCPEDIAQFAREFDCTTKLVIESDREPVYVKVAGRRERSPPHHILSGRLELSGEEATSLFSGSVDAIIEAFEQQKRSLVMPITLAYLVGGLVRNEWLRSRLQSYFRAHNIKICSLDNANNKIVAKGAVLSYVDEDPLIAPRVAHSAYDMIAHQSCSLRREKAALEKAVQSLHEQQDNSNKRIAQLEDKTHALTETVQSLRAMLRVRELKEKCEILFAEGREHEAAESAMTFVNTASEAVAADGLFDHWIEEFIRRCVSALEVRGDAALSRNNDDEAMVAYSTVLCFSRSTSVTVLEKWVRIMLAHGAAGDTWNATAKFKLPKFVICRMICDTLEGEDRVMDAVECYRRIASDLAADTGFHDGRVEWEPGFMQRCEEKLITQGNDAMSQKRYTVAADHFSKILSLNPKDRANILICRSQARASMYAWEEALCDANEAIGIGPSCYRGYERKYAALHGAKQYEEAVHAFDEMLSKLRESSNGGLLGRYVDARPLIRETIHRTLRLMPRVLIDTATGRLCDKQKQGSVFETLPIYFELVSSMTTRLDNARITTVVEEFYQYVMLSHRWDSREVKHPELKNISIYDLPPIPTNNKLRQFCVLARSFNFRWAWSDSSCVDRDCTTVLQESLVAMFTWYRGSALTIVYLRGVWAESQVPGDLSQSEWNTRAWTYQEYVAAEIIQFYTEDWKPYLGLQLFNHKKSRAIIAEMQQVSGVSAEEMAILPGQDRVRQKLYLASKRKAMLVEDTAYSLFGIFGVALPIVYGEGNQAVGRLLEHVLTGSGDPSVLAWTGKAGDYNSCIPADLAVYDQVDPPHVSCPIEQVEMDRIITTLQQNMDDPSIAISLHNQLRNLPLPLMASKRLRLPGIIFPLLDALEEGPISGFRIYRATTQTFGEVEIKTADDLTGKRGLSLVHPWIRPLRDQEFSDGTDALDEVTQSLRFVARLRQPFGALLFEQLSSVEYRRVAADSLIVIRIREDVSLSELRCMIRTIEVL